MKNAKKIRILKKESHVSSFYLQSLQNLKKSAYVDDSDYEYEDSSEDEKKTLNSYGSSKSRKNSLHKYAINFIIIISKCNIL